MNKIELLKNQVDNGRVISRGNITLLKGDSNYSVLKNNHKKLDTSNFNKAHNYFNII